MGRVRCPATDGGALRARERVQGAAAATAWGKRRFRALAGGPRAARAHHGAAARFVNACSFELCVATTGFGGQFDPEDVLLPPPDPYINRRGIKFTTRRNTQTRGESYF